MCQCRTVCLAVGLHPVLHLRLVTALSHSLEAYLGVGDNWSLSVIREHVDFVMSPRCIPRNCGGAQSIHFACVFASAGSSWMGML